MKKIIGFSLIMAAIFSVAVTVQAQAVASADVRFDFVRLIEASDRLVTHIRVTSDNDDDARETTLIVLIPFQTKVLRLSRGCTPYPTPSPYPGEVQGFVRCFLGHIPVGGAREVEISTTKPPVGVRKHVSAFVWNLLPDPNPSNNFGEAFIN